MRKLLIVEDDIAFAKILEGFLKKKDFSVSLATTVKDAGIAIQKQHFDIFLLDYRPRRHRPRPFGEYQNPQFKLLACSNDDKLSRCKDSGESDENGSLRLHN